ncbi:hypothetical protein MKW92_049866 [Papaver armeniacum]|nr:hypothetical protein MKW92_049866 [Papaver armeniacum]
METGSFQLAARYCQVIGKLYEVEQNIEKALIYFERAADLIQSDKLSTFGLVDCNECKQKVAQFSAQLEQYSREIAINEDLAKQSLNKNLSKSSVKGYLLNAGLCQLFKADAVAVSNALERYEELDPTFPGTHEYKFLADLAASVVEEDAQKFTDVVKKLDSMAKLDAWKATLLMKIEEKLKAKKMMAIDHKRKAMI